MKRLVLSLILLGMSSAHALTPDFTAYMRAGTGGNSHGGAMECFHNKGAATGNEFRLGNECGIYGEFQFGAQLLKDPTEKGPYWKLGSNFAFVTKNATDFETTNDANDPGGNPNNWVVRELYTEGGNFDGMPFSVWAGKRFYRWGALHMDDFFPIDMSGPGAGVGNISSDWGQWSVGVIQNSESSEFPGKTTTVKTTKGRAAKTSLHIRTEDLDTSFGKFGVWLAGAMTPEATSTTGAQQYKKGSGGMVGAKHDVKVGPGTNELGVAYGTGVLSNLTAHGDLVLDCPTTTNADCTVNKSNRVRAWEGYTMDWDRWSAEIAVIYDEYNSGADQESHIKWTSVGARPMYWFNDHFSLAFEAGVSNVIDEADQYGSRNLVRTTIAPQFSIGKGYTSRPVIRAFYTMNSWNDNNKISMKDTTAANDNQAQTVGVQTEIWF